MASLQEKMAEFLRGKKAPKQEKTIEEEREMARQMSKAIPEGAFPHAALRQKKKQMADLDEQTKE
jgi:hypothetical protein